MGADNQERRLGSKGGTCARARADALWWMGTTTVPTPTQARTSCGVWRAKKDASLPLWLGGRDAQRGEPSSYAQPSRR